MEIKNLKKAGQRILRAIKNKEKIIIYGDADFDGTAAVVILKEAIEKLKGDISAIYFVDREEEGYGLNKKALNFLKPLAPALLICLDLGITNFKETKIAKKLGFEVIIIDHHKIIDRLPEASIIVDPKQRGDKYPFKEFATVGLVYELVKIIFGKDLTKDLNNSFLELVALATIADMMPQERENKQYIEQGLTVFKKTKRLGLEFLLKTKDFEDLTENEKIQKIVSTLNMSEIKNHLTEAYLLFICQNKKEVRELIDRLLERSLQRHGQIREITEEIKERIKEDSSLIVFEGDLGWPNLLVGSVASRICHKFKKPTFVYKKGESESIGSVRMPKGMDAVKAMQSCQKLLITFGGHPPAAGFRIKNQNLEKFKNCLIKYFETLDE